MIFSIFKIIGILLLIILGILLAAVLYLLFSPIGYRAAGELVEEHKQVTLSVYDALKLVKFSFDYSDGTQKSTISILWGLIKKGSTAEVKEEEEAEDGEEGPAKTGGDEKASDAEIPPEENFSEKETEVIIPKLPDDPEEEFMNAVTEEALASAAKTKLSVLKRVSSVAERVDEGAKKASSLWDEVTDERNQEAVKYVIDRAIRLIGRILPQLHAANASYAMADPSQTGMLTGVLSLCPCCYGKRVHLAPDFASREIYVRGTADIRGELRLYLPVGFVIGVLLNNNCRRLYKRFKNRG